MIFNDWYAARVNLTYRVKSAHKLKLTDKQLLQWTLPVILIMVRIDNDLITFNIICKGYLPFNVDHIRPPNYCGCRVRKVENRNRKKVLLYNFHPIWAIYLWEKSKFAPNLNLRSNNSVVFWKRILCQQNIFSDKKKKTIPSLITFPGVRYLR